MSNSTEFFGAECEYDPKIAPNPITFPRLRGYEKELSCIEWEYEVWCPENIADVSWSRQGNGSGSSRTDFQRLWSQAREYLGEEESMISLCPAPLLDFRIEFGQNHTPSVLGGWSSRAWFQFSFFCQVSRSGFKVQFVHDPSVSELSVLQLRSTRRQSLDLVDGVQNYGGTFKKVCNRSWSGCSCWKLMWVLLRCSHLGVSSITKTLLLKGSK